MRRPEARRRADEPRTAADRGGFCFVHAADLHLGGRRWLQTTPPFAALVDRVRRADRLALHALTELCLAERAALLLLAGDVIDGWCRDHRVGLELERELLRLERAGCHVAIVLGNHDLRTRVMLPLLLPGNARVLGLHEPETLVFEELGLAVHGVSVPELSVPGLTESIGVLGAFPRPRPDLLNVGLLHTSAEGIRGHADYHPCSRRALRNFGYDYWALGHVHSREVVAEDPWIVFPGNLQARGAREAGAKGATLVRVKSQRIASVAPCRLDVLGFETIRADVSAAESFSDVLVAARQALAQAAASPERPLILRLVIAGAAGAARILEVPPWERDRAFQALKHDVASESLWIDEIWSDAGDVAGAWLLGQAA